MCKDNNMIKFLVFIVLFFSFNTFAEAEAEAETENLWRGFYYGMSPSEVLDEIKKTKKNTKGKIGVKGKITKKIKKDQEIAWRYALEQDKGYCSIWTTEISVGKRKTAIYWCFDKPTSKNEPNADAKLRFIKIWIKNQFTNVETMLTSRYKTVYPSEWLNSDTLKVESRFIDNCGHGYTRDGYGSFTFTEKSTNVFAISFWDSVGYDIEPHILFVKKDDMVKIQQDACLFDINEMLLKDF